MKIQNVKKLCNRQHCIRIVEKILPGEVRQYIGDGNALYFTGGLPPVDVDSVCAGFDIPDKKRHLFDIDTVNGPNQLSFADSIKTDTMLEKDGVHLLIDGVDYIPLYTSKGIRILDAAYLAPLDDAAEPVTLWERFALDGKMYIVAMDGMFLAAILPAHPVPEVVTQSMRSMLEAIPPVELAEGCDCDDSR